MDSGEDGGGDILVRQGIGDSEVGSRKGESNTKASSWVGEPIYEDHKG